MRHRSLRMYPESGNHWSVGRGGISKEVAEIVRARGGIIKPDDKGRTEFVLLQLGEDRGGFHPFPKTNEQIRLMFTIEEAKWLIDAVNEVIDEIESSEVSFDLPPAAPASLPPPNLSQINLDISNEDMVGSV